MRPGDGGDNKTALEKIHLKLIFSCNKIPDGMVAMSLGQVKYRPGMNF